MPLAQMLNALASHRQRAMCWG